MAIYLIGMAVIAVAALAPVVLDIDTPYDDEASHE